MHKDQAAVMMFDWLHHAVATNEGKVLYILALICVAMIVDFLVGSLAAWRNPDIKFTSQKGIDGILRKPCRGWRDRLDRALSGLSCDGTGQHRRKSGQSGRACGTASGVHRECEGCHAS